MQQLHLKNILGTGRNSLRKGRDSARGTKEVQVGQRRRKIISVVAQGVGSGRLAMGSLDGTPSSEDRLTNEMA
jgi:hypothetical protein